MKKVLLLLAEGFEIYKASAFIDVIGWNLTEGDGTTRLFSCALKKQICSTFDQKIVVDYTIDEIDVTEFEALAIAGGFTEYGFYTDAFDERFLQLLREFDNKGKSIVSVCTGGLPVAISGLLKNRNATTYNLGREKQRMMASFGAILKEGGVVVDRNIVTSTSPATAMEVAFLLLEQLTSKQNAQKIRHLMGFKKNLTIQKEKWIFG